MPSAIRIPCIGLTGIVSAGQGTEVLFKQPHALTELATIAQAKANSAHWLERLTGRAAAWKSEGRNPRRA